MIHPAPLYVFALRHGLRSIADVLATLRAAFLPEAVGLAWGLAPGLDDAQLAALRDALRDARMPIAPAQHEQLRRGQLAAARGDGAAIAHDALELALGRATGGERAAWIAGGLRSLDAVFADAGADTRARLAIAKIALRFAPPDVRVAHLAGLRAGVEQDLARDAYAELDVMFGDVDPVLELARTSASVDVDPRDLLDAREARVPAFFNVMELADAVDIVVSAPAERRTDHVERFTRWLAATEDRPEERGVFAARWLTSSAPPDADAALRALIAGPITAAALLEIVAAERTPEPLRAAAVARLVEIADAHVATLVDVTREGKVADWGRHATAVRGVRTASCALARDGVQVDPIRDRLRAVARAWSDWVVTQDVAFDSLPHVFTGIAFATLAPDAVGPASAHLTRVVREGRPMVLDYDGWDRLYAPDAALAVARAALGG